MGAVESVPKSNGSTQVSRDSDDRSSFIVHRSSLRILGIDPGLNITGYAILETERDGPKVAEAGIVRGRSKASLSSRLAEIHDGVADVIAAFHPSAMALEQLYSHYEHPRTSILMGHARGDYQHVSPNDHVNASQSTNDVYPTALKLAMLAR